MSLSSILFSPLAKSLSVLAVSMVALHTTAQAQINKAAPSPHATTVQQVGLSKVTLDYSRPGVKGRKIFGELEAYGAVWRAGANACTTIEFDANAMVAGSEVPAGKYSVFTIPQKDKWTFILNKDTGLWGAGGYDPAKDIMRVELPIIALKDVHETLTIEFAGFHSNGANLCISWANTKISVPVVIDSDAMVFAEIDEKIINAKGEISGRTYFDAAMFYFEKKKDLPLAATWMDKAVELNPEAFWQIYAQAEMALHMGDSAKAITCVEASIKMAKKSPQGDYGYVAKGKKLLEKINAK
ncbi:MAG: hypothetical protein ACI9X4_000817 [Glaciecola sp.]|jgi:hypothetical protein